MNDSTIDTVEKALQTLKKIDKACTDALKGDLTSLEKKVVNGIQAKLFPNSPNECLNAVKRVEEISSALRKAEHVVGKGFNTNSFIRFLGACKAATKAFFTPKQSAVKAFKEVYHKDVVNTLKQRMASKEEEEAPHDRPKLGH
ncbi:hypothetical protein [Legionella fairfieldensis]|uniref:hypothetical protein n=1 Tax=Legionella fairfieldensis TaxID=45064 RepID=UPI0004902B2C|nr:hypothetical protein [Legionella fairfieldensis]